MFETFLQEKFNQEYPGILDDDLENAFETWLTNLDIDTVIKYADEFKLK